MFEPIKKEKGKELITQIVFDKAELAKEVAEKALDEFIYKGKTLREWVEIITGEQDLLVITELEKIKKKIKKIYDDEYLSNLITTKTLNVIDERIAELKGE